MGPFLWPPPATNPDCSPRGCLSTSPNKFASYGFFIFLKFTSYMGPSLPPPPPFATIPGAAPAAAWPRLPLNLLLMGSPFCLNLLPMGPSLWPPPATNPDCSPRRGGRNGTQNLQFGTQNLQFQFQLGLAGGGGCPGLLGLVWDSWAALRHWLGGSRPRLGPHPLLRVLPCRRLAPPSRTAALVAA